MARLGRLAEGPLPRDERDSPPEPSLRSRHSGWRPSACRSSTHADADRDAFDRDQHVLGHTIALLHPSQTVAARPRSNQRDPPGCDPALSPPPSKRLQRTGPFGVPQRRGAGAAGRQDGPVGLRVPARRDRRGCPRPGPVRCRPAVPARGDGRRRLRRLRGRSDRAAAGGGRAQGDHRASGSICCPGPGEADAGGPTSDHRSRNTRTSTLARTGAQAVSRLRRRRRRPHSAGDGGRGCKMVNMFPTTSGRLYFISPKMKAQGEREVLSLSTAHGFPWGDAGRQRGEDVCWRWSMAMSPGPAASPSSARVSGRCAMRSPRPGYRSKQPSMPSLGAGRGSAGPGGDRRQGRQHRRRCAGRLDLRPAAGLRAGALADVALGPLWDAVAVRFCHDAGVGAVLDARIGGKCGPGSGSPIDLKVTVRPRRRSGAARAGLSQPPRPRRLGRAWRGPRGPGRAASAGLLAGAVHQHRGPARNHADRGRQVDRPLPGRLRADRPADPDHRGAGDLHRRSGAIPYRNHNLNYWQVEAEPSDIGSIESRPTGARHSPFHG